MADPLSIGAGVVGVVAAVAHTVHEIINLIDDIEGAPSAVRQIRTELNDVECVVVSLEDCLQSNVNNAIWNQLLNGSKLSNALKTLKSVCEGFLCTLQGWTKHIGSSDKLSLRDSFVIATHSRKISQLSTQLNSCKQTVTIALSNCVLQGQIQNAHTTERIVELMTQERQATRLLSAQRAVIEDLRSQEQQLQIIKTQSEEAGDIDEIERVEEDIRDVSRARITVNQFATVSEYVAKSSAATRTRQDISNVVIAELGYGAIGISNVDEVSNQEEGSMRLK